jgi:hypothetical protein
MVQMNDNDTTFTPGEDAPPPAGSLPRIAGDDRGLPAAVPSVIQSVGRTRAFAAGGGRGKMRAADADRDRVVEFLTTAYSEGRLSKDEYDARLENALSARTYADLDQIVTDLPIAWVATEPSVANTNGLAIASLACGLAQFVFGPLAAIPAIVFGHMARHQIKRTGEQGAGLALAGLILGWAVVILGIVLIVIALVVAAGMHGTMQMH